MRVPSTAARGLFAGLIYVAATGCGNSPPSTAAGADASVSEAGQAASTSVSPQALRTGVPMPLPNAGGILHRQIGDAAAEHPTLVAARAIVVRHPILAASLSESPKGLSLESAGFVTEAWRKPSATQLDLIGSVLPHRANDLWRSSPGRVEKWAMSLEPVGFLDVPGRLDAGRVVYPLALPHTDLIAVARDREVEQFLLLKDSSAPTEVRWKMHLGSDLHTRILPSGAIDLLDGKGQAALRVQVPFAIDSTGKRVDAKLTLDHDELVIQLDSTGLTYPVLLDPVVEVPIWQLATSSGLPAIDGNGLAYNASSGKTVLVGGTTVPGIGDCPGSYTSQSYTWDGTTWGSLFGGPTNRWAAAVSTYGAGVIVFGGQSCSSGPATFLGDTYTLSGGSWTLQCASGFCLPPKEKYAQMAYLPGTGAVLFSGIDANTYIFNAGSWSKFVYSAGDLANGLVPPIREGGQMSTDPGTGKVLLLGGWTPSTSVLLADAWEFNPLAAGTYADPHWYPVCGPGSTVGCPFAPRVWPGLAFDSNRKRHVFFGGDSYSIGVLVDTWEFQSQAGAKTSGVWTQLCASCAQERRLATLAYDSGRRRFVSAAGEDHGLKSDTWELYVRGGSCSVDADCDTSHCVEGTCCETTCAECQTCASAGTPGVCANVVAGNPDPQGICPLLCNGSSGAAACTNPNGTICASAATCASGFCTDGRCCKFGVCGGGTTCNDPSGTCLKKVGVACLGPAECASGNCVDGTCCSSSSCGASQHCNFVSNPGTCLSDNGQACALASACGSNNCVDGYCCNSICGGECQACDIGGSLGTCIPVTGAAHTTSGLRSACPGSGSCGGVCNGSDVTACHYPGSGTSCGSASCSSGSATAVGTCSGAGGCNQPITSCGAYSCGGTTCKTTCSVDTDCFDTSTYFCSAGTCTTKLALGGTCSGASACTSGFCAGTTCCDAACGAAGYSCSVPGSVGHCAKINGTACSSGGECASRNCIDGVCCNSACGGQCQACDAVGSIGTCTTVSGPSHTTSGVRSACGGSGTCGALCNGSDPIICHYPGAATACGSASCTSGVGTTIGGCNAAGGCNSGTTPCGNYACGLTACKTSCGTDTDCATTAYYCTGGSCQLKLGNGSTCAIPDACQSGNCVTGICCDTTCTGTGFSCNLAGSPGHCTKAPGTACTASAECGSGNCVDGVCCDTACAGDCQACDVGGSVGKCTAVIGAPHGTRPACGGTGVGTACGPTCDGKTVGACTYPTGTTTCGAATCTDGSSLSTYTQVGACSGTGSCTAGSGDCGTFRCSGGTCGTKCTAKSQCSAGNYCDTVKGICIPIVGLGNSCSDPTACPSGFCVDGVCCEAACGAGFSCNATPTTKGHCRKLTGVACLAGGECASGSCVDGFCCTSSCTGSCEACNVSGKEGTCTAIVGQPKPGHASCSATPTDPTCGLACDGSDSAACHNATTSVACGTAACAGGIENDVSTCDGSGACKSATRACSAYACGPTSCLGTCTVDSDCSKGSFCKAGSCIGAQALGESCTEDLACKSGHCAMPEGICCSVAGCTAGAACAGPGASAGTCLKSNSSACAAAGECASGHCVDGSCCDKACDGQCEACDVKGSEGTCTPATGAPHGTRTACDALTATDCAKTTCDGAARDKCAGFSNGATTSCGADTCTADKKYQKHGNCDGKGGCQKPDPSSCSEYVCDAATSACRTGCAKDDDCAATYKCDTAAGKCVQGSTCSADKSASIDKAGVSLSCAPYLCGTDGKCAVQCATSSDCVPGSSCDNAVHACVAVGASTSASGGCAVTSAPSTSPRTGFGLAALVVAASWIARRRSTKRDQRDRG